MRLIRQKGTWDSTEGEGIGEYGGPYEGSIGGVLGDVDGRFGDEERPVSCM